MRGEGEMHAFLILFFSQADACMAWDEARRFDQWGCFKKVAVETQLCVSTRILYFLFSLPRP